MLQPFPINITLTQRAAEQVRMLIEQERKKEPTLGQVYVRLRIVGNGVEGFRRKLDLDTATTEHDCRVESQGITIVMDQRSALFCPEAIIDYVETPEKTGFDMKTPEDPPAPTPNANIKPARRWWEFWK